MLRRADRSDVWLPIKRQFSKYATLKAYFRLLAQGYVCDFSLYDCWVVLENNNEHLKQPSERHLTCPLLSLPEGTSPGCSRREALGVPGSAEG